MRPGKLCQVSVDHRGHLRQIPFKAVPHFGNILDQIACLIYQKSTSQIEEEHDQCQNRHDHDYTAELSSHLQLLLKEDNQRTGDQCNQPTNHKGHKKEDQSGGKKDDQQQYYQCNQ